MDANKANGQYEVLSPWADADPIPLEGLSPRLTDLARKKIGLYHNAKLAARPILTVVGEKLKERYPTCEIKWHGSLQPPWKVISDFEGEDKVKFDEWVKEVDAVVTAVGD